MTYYALKDSDWAFDDQDEGRAIIVRADTPEEAISKATEKHIKEYPGSGGITWDVARLDLTGFGDAEWDDDNLPKFEPFRFYAEGSSEPSETYKRIKALEPQLAAAKKALTDIQCIDWDGLSVSDVFDEINEIVERAALEVKP